MIGELFTLESGHANDNNNTNTWMVINDGVVGDMITIQVLVLLLT